LPARPRPPLRLRLHSPSCSPPTSTATASSLPPTCPARPPNLCLPGTRPSPAAGPPALDLAGACSARRPATLRRGGPGRAWPRHRWPRQARPARSRAGRGWSCSGTAGGCGSGVRLEGAATAGVAELRSLPSLSYQPARALPSLELGEPSGARAASEAWGACAAARDPAARRVHAGMSTTPEHSLRRLMPAWAQSSLASLAARDLAARRRQRIHVAAIRGDGTAEQLPLPLPLPLSSHSYPRSEPQAHRWSKRVLVCVSSRPRRFAARWDATMEMAMVSPWHGTTTLELVPHAPLLASTPLPPVVFCSQEEQAEQLW